MGRHWFNPVRFLLYTTCFFPFFELFPSDGLWVAMTKSHTFMLPYVFLLPVKLIDFSLGWCWILSVKTNKGVSYFSLAFHVYYHRIVFHCFLLFLKPGEVKCSMTCVLLFIFHLVVGYIYPKTQETGRGRIKHNILTKGSRKGTLYFPKANEFQSRLNDLSKILTNLCFKKIFQIFHFEFLGILVTRMRKI